MNVLNDRSRRHAGLFALCLFWLPCAWAGEDKTQAEPVKKEAATDKVKDPTRPGPNLKQLLKGAERKAEIAAPPPAATLPVITIKAIVKAENRPATAMLQIGDKELVTVKAGSELTLNSGSGGALRVTVKKVSEEGVEFEDAMQKSIVIAR